MLNPARPPAVIWPLLWSHEAGPWCVREHLCTAALQWAVKSELRGMMSSACCNTCSPIQWDLRACGRTGQGTCGIFNTFTTSREHIGWGRESTRLLLGGPSQSALGRTWRGCLSELCMGTHTLTHVHTPIHRHRLIPSPVGVLLCRLAGVCFRHQSGQASPAYYISPTHPRSQQPGAARVSPLSYLIVAPAARCQAGLGHDR